MARFSASVRKLFAGMFAKQKTVRKHPPRFGGQLERLEIRDVPAVYYVATNGSDSGAGSTTSPFQTIQHAANVVQAGDTVIVRSGTYAGFILGYDTATAGTASKPITFEADPAAAPGSVVINARNNKTPTGIDIEPGCDYITIQGFTVDGSGSGGIATYPNKGYGIKVTGSHDQVLNNTIKNLDYGIAGIHDNGGDYDVIQGNTVTAIHNHGNSTMGHGIYVADATGVVVNANQIYNNDYIGIHINGDPNTVSNALIENNVIYNNGQNGINADGLQNSTIQNNLIYGFANSGICLFYIDSSGPSKNNVIVNNTIVSTQSGAGAAIRILDAGTGNTILNNVLLGGGGVSMRISADSMSGLTSNYNVLGTSFQSEDTGASQTVAQWQSSTGQDKRSITSSSTALFTNASNGDYSLKSGSPAIGAGTGTDAPTTDILGNTRNSSSIDIGAYAASSGSSAPAAAAQLQVSAPSSATSGSSFTVTVKALTSSGATATGFTGTVNFTSSDGQAVLPSSYTFTAADAGVHTFTVTLKTAGAQTVTVTDPPGDPLTGSASVSVSGSSSGSGSGTGTGSGTNLALSGTGYRWSGMTSSTANTGQVAASGLNDGSTASSVALSGSASGGGGVLDASNAWEAAGVVWSAPQTVSKVVYTNGAYTSSSDGVFGAGFTLQFTTDGKTWANAPSSWTADVGYSYNSAGAGGQVITFTGSSTSVLGFRLVGQVHTAQTSSWYASTSEVQAYGPSSAPAAAAQVQVSAPSSATSGSSFTVTVKALTSSGATATGYTGTVTLTSSDGQAVLPSSYTFTAADAGVHTFTVTLKTAGAQTVTVTDGAGLTGSASVSVSGSGSGTGTGSGTNLAQSGTGYRWSGMTSSTANTGQVAASGLNDGSTASSVALSGSASGGGGVLDASNAWEAAGVVWSAPQTVSKVVYTNGAYTSTADGVFDAGFTLQFTTDGKTWVNAPSTWTADVGYSYNSAGAGGQVVTFTGPSTGVLGFRLVGQVHTVKSSSWYASTSEVQAYGPSSAPAAAAQVQVSAPSSATSGSSFTVTVKALTSSGATATGYTGTVTLTSSDGQAVLPSSYTFTAADAGVHTFTITLKTAGSQSVTVTDKASAGLTGSAVVSVGAAAPATNLALSGTGYRWSGMTSSSANTGQVAASGLNDGSTTSSVALSGSASGGGGVLDASNAWEAAGVVWSAPQTVSKVVYTNGAYTSSSDGVFGAGFTLQFTTDGKTWANAPSSWTANVGYSYNSAGAGGQVITFTGPSTGVLGFRLVGQVHTAQTSSWYASASEVQAYA